MKICAIGMVKNEADIIEAFVRHTLHYVDSIYLIENGSQDKTPQILARLQAEGLPLQLEHDPTFRYNQAEKTTRLYRKIQQQQPHPSFIIPLDADEFIQAPSREFFYDALERIPPHCVGKWRWRTCLPTKPNELELSKRFPVARKHEAAQHGKIIIRCPKPADTTLEIMQGAHSATRSGRKLRGIMYEDMYLAHLPIRSTRQLAQKVILGWMANVAQFKTTDPACGFHWGQLYRRALDLTPEDLVREAYNYSETESRTDLDCTTSNLRIEGLTTSLNCDTDTALEFKSLLDLVCRSWEASLLSG